MAAKTRGPQYAARGAAMEDAVRVPVVIVGAGAAGLATAACLRQQGIQSLVVERASSVGASWRGRYDRLHLHTPKELSGLPGFRWPKGTPRYPSRDQVVDYLEKYAAHFDVRPRFDSTVKDAQYRAGFWEVATSTGRIRADQLVVAAGYNATPVIPSFDGELDFIASGGTIVHSAAYRNPQPYVGKRVLVVGAGNSGAEIALDLAEDGRVEVSWLVRSPTHVTPRDVGGVPSQVTAQALDKLPTRVADEIALGVSKRVFPDLEDLGLERPRVGPVTQVDRTGRIPLIDLGTIDMLRRGRLGLVRSGISRFDKGRVHFDNAESLDLDAVVLATGYRTNLDSWLSGAPRVTDERRIPVDHAEETVFPGLFFVGYRNPLIGALLDMGREGKRVAELIAKKRGKAGIRRFLRR